MRGISDSGRGFVRLAGKEFAAEVQDLAFRLGRRGFDVVVVAKAITGFESGRRAAASARGNAPSDSSTGVTPPKVPQPPSPTANVDGLAARKRRRTGKGSALKRKELRAAKHAAAGTAAAEPLRVATEAAMDEELNSQSAPAKAATRKEHTKAVSQASAKIAEPQRVVAPEKSAAVPASKGAPEESAPDNASPSPDSKRLRVDLAAASAEASSRTCAFTERIFTAQQAASTALRFDAKLDHQTFEQAEKCLLQMAEASCEVRKLKLGLAARPTGRFAVVYQVDISTAEDLIRDAAFWLNEHVAKVVMDSESVRPFREAVGEALDPLNGLDAHLYR